MKAEDIPVHQTCLEVENLSTHFFTDEGVVRAVDGLSFKVQKGKTLALVGESGSGKSITAFSILGLVSHPGRIVGGAIRFYESGETWDLAAMNPKGSAIRKIRGDRIAMVFQEPMSSFSPVYTVGSQVAESLRLHRGLSRKQARIESLGLMQRVGIPEPAMRYGQYPHEMSGGLRQRAMIAMALACRPTLLIADEPTTALDVTIQAQILELLRDLQAEFRMSILLITHDLGVVAEMADDVAIMYLGQVVEQGGVEAIFDQPQHPYTRALLRSIPSRADKRKAPLEAIPGSVPEAHLQIAGCPFHPRCSEAVGGLCDHGGRPPLFGAADGHQHACLVRKQEMEAAQ